MSGRPALLHGEGELLGAPSLGSMLDGGVAAAADAAEDPWAHLRVAGYEQLAGRDPECVRRLDRVLASTAEPTARRAAEALLSTARFWTGSVDPHRAVPMSDDESGDERGVLLSWCAVALQWLNLDQHRSGRTWTEVDSLVGRITGGADRWLAHAETPARFADGLNAAVHAAAVGFLSGRAPWSAGYVDRLRDRATALGFAAWLPLIDFWGAFAAQHVGEFTAAEELARRALPGLRRDRTSPWVPIALATAAYTASLREDAEPAELSHLERELLVGAWRSRRPAVAHTCVQWIASVLADLGSAGEGMEALEELGPLDSLWMVHEDRVRVHEIAVVAALERGDRAQAGQWLRRMGRLMGSPARDAAVARARVLLDGTGPSSWPRRDPVSAARASGNVADHLRAHWAVLASAIAQGERRRALGELAALDEVAARLRASAVRVRAVRMFAPAQPHQQLTPRQLEVAALAATGMSNREIAALVHLGVRTVESYLAEALAALGLSRRAELALVALPGATAASQHPADAPALLTARQGQIAALVSAGSSNSEIASALGISPKTVEKHIALINDALGTRSRAGIAAAFLRAGQPDRPRGRAPSS